MTVNWLCLFWFFENESETHRNATKYGKRRNEDLVLLCVMFVRRQWLILISNRQDLYLRLTFIDWIEMQSKLERRMREDRLQKAENFCTTEIVSLSMFLTFANPSVVSPCIVVVLLIAFCCATDIYSIFWWSFVGETAKNITMDFNFDLSICTLSIFDVYYFQHTYEVANGILCAHWKLKRFRTVNGFMITGCGTMRIHINDAIFKEYVPKASSIGIIIFVRRQSLDSRSTTRKSP